MPNASIRCWLGPPRNPTRRRVLVAVTLALAASSPAAAMDLSIAAKLPPARAWKASGQDVPSLRGLDAAMRAFVQSNQVSAAALAVTHERRLVYARGFRWAVPGGTDVTPHSLFRIASVSKPITATAILRLVQDGRLRLKDKVAEIIDLHPNEGVWMEPRLARITVRQLLQHTAGWARFKTFDPMFRDEQIGRVLRVPQPISTRHIIRYMGGRPLDFDPGERYAYSNYGYCLLGRVIEERSGRPYEDYVRETILLPLGASATRLGRSAREDRFPEEVVYESEEQSPYGTFRLENMDAHGGWVSSVVDLARFAAAFDEPDDCPFLTRDFIEAMFGRPNSPASEKPKPNTPYYACGWQVRENAEGRRNTWHTGSLPGTYAVLLRWRSGINCVALFNRRGPNFGRIDPILFRAVHAVTEWPSHDLFTVAGNGSAGASDAGPQGVNDRTR